MASLQADVSCLAKKWPVNRSLRNIKYFPLKQPIWVPPGATVNCNIWRRSDESRVWYEWCAEVVDNRDGGTMEPCVLTASSIHNPGGRSYHVKKWWNLSGRIGLLLKHLLHSSKLCIPPSNKLVFVRLAGASLHGCKLIYFPHMWYKTYIWSLLVVSLCFVLQAPWLWTSSSHLPTQGSKINLINPGVIDKTFPPYASLYLRTFDPPPQSYVYGANTSLHKWWKNFVMMVRIGGPAICMPSA